MINRLRVIHIYEHDCNLILALQWRDLIHHSIQHNLLHPSQYGGIPGWTSVQPTLIEEFQNEICHASRRPLVHLDYNAAPCYNHITLNMASIISRAYGLHRNITTTNATTLQHAKYVLRTQLGTSQCSYTHTQKPVVWHRTRRGKFSSSLGAAKLNDVFIIFISSSWGSFLPSVKNSPFASRHGWFH